eukprot:scaffold2505_cov152-Ochromonas_danica.AAC.3
MEVRYIVLFSPNIPSLPSHSDLSCVTSPFLQDIDKKKYLVPADLTCGQFIYVIRKRLKLPSEKALFLFVNGSIPPTSAMLNAIYDQHKDKDGFLYMCYSEENVFG